MANTGLLPLSVRLKCRMRRRLRLKVLYWPAITSASIVMLLVLSGPLDPWLRPLVGPFWAGGNFADGRPDAGWRLPTWPPTSSTARGLSDFAAPGQQGARQPGAGQQGQSLGRAAGSRPLSPPKSLFNRGILDSEIAYEAPHPRGNDAVGRPDWVPSPVAVSAGRLSGSPLAAATLRAPEISVSEELAGLDFTRFAEETSRPAAAVFQTTASRSGRSIGTEDRLGDSAENRVASPRSGSVSDFGSPGRSGSFVGDSTPLSETAKRSPSQRHGLGNGWPETPQLIADLHQVAMISRPGIAGTALVGFKSTSQSVTDFQAWHHGVSDHLTRLRELPSIASPESATILQSLAVLADDGYQAAEAVADRNAQIACLRATHSLLRRVAVWTAVHQAAGSATLSPGDEQNVWAGRDSIGRLLSGIESEAADSADAAGWRTFLLLDELSAANVGGDETKRRLVAQRFLSRLQWFGLTDAQSAWLDRDSIRTLAQSVRHWALAPVDYAALLSQIERQESDAIDLGGIDVARAAQSLRFAGSNDAQAVASRLNAYYRNANARIAVSGDLITRMIPEVDARVEPVRQRILGADVRGLSHIDSSVAVRLVPSPASWRLQLETSGRVISDTASRSGPVSVRTGSTAAFRSVTPLEITRLSAIAGGTSVDVGSNTHLRGVDTDYDSIPLVSTLIREIAVSRYQSKSPAAKRIQHGQIRDGVGSEVDKRVNQQLDDASLSFTRHLVGPLGSLGLSPMVVDMQTTEDRLTARYRVGGDWQLAAFTPRPRAPSDSLLSVQIHQSVLNNTIETALPAGESKTIRELVDELRSRFAIADSVNMDDGESDELRDDAIIHFAATRPVTVEIEDETIWITLRVMRLHAPGSIDLRRFVVRAAYRPEINGLSAQLVRDGHLTISGPGMTMRDRLPIRAIFTKVFSPQRPLAIVPARLADHPAMQGLVINQFELRDGWIGLGIGPASKSTEASKSPEPSKSPEASGSPATPRMAQKP